MKHNKKRNTAFIYEILIKEFTKSIIEKDTQKKNKIVVILKEFFTKGQILAQEVNLYTVLLETKNTQPKVAERLLQETKSARARLNENTIFDAQSRIIAAINKGLGKNIWGNFVPNFKSLASVAAIFNPKSAIKKKVLFEQSIVDRMSEKQHLSESNNLKSLDNLTYNSFIKKYNEKYGNLLQEQKDLLNRFITSFADEGFELRLYLNEELFRLKSLLSEAAAAELEPLISQKTNEVVEYLEEFRRREFSDADLNKILKTQELVRELGTND
jgi:hypothetical protein